MKAKEIILAVMYMFVTGRWKGRQVWDECGQGDRRVKRVKAVIFEVVLVCKWTQIMVAFSSG